MHYTVEFVGTESQKVDRAWEETIAYLGSLAPKLYVIRAEQLTVTHPERAEFVADTVGMFWGIDGHYPHLALAEFFMGKRDLEV